MTSLPERPASSISGAPSPHIPILLDTPADAAFDRLTWLAAQVLEAPFAVINLVDGQRFFIKSEVGLPHELAQQREISMTESLCALVVAAREPLVIKDTALDPRFARHPAVVAGIAAYISVPLKTATGDIIGTLCVADHQTRPWRSDALAILRRLGESVMQEIELQGYMRQVSSAYDHLLSQHEALREQDAFLDALLHSGSDMLGVLDSEGNILYTSPSVGVILGYDASELLGRSAFGLMHPDDRQRIVESFEKLFDVPGVGVPVEFRFRHANGAWIALEAIGTNHLMTPSIRGIVINARDVTVRRQLELAMERQNEELRDLIVNRTRELDEARFEILARLAMAAEYRDDVTGEHIQRVGLLACRLAALLGLPSEQIACIERSAPLHDVGKIGISDQILLKPGRLTLEERAVMETHTLIGARILTGSQVVYLQMAEEIAMSHHERWDGRGYPRGLAGESIPIIGRIVAVADVLDALTHERPYKHAWPLKEAIAEIAGQRGRQFDPQVVDALLVLYDQHLAGAGTFSDFEVAARPTAPTPPPISGHPAPGPTAPALR